MTSGTSSRDSKSCAPGVSPHARAEVGGVRVLPEHRAPDDHELHIGSLTARDRVRVEQHVEPLERIEARRPRRPRSASSGMADPVAERAPRGRRELVGVEVLVEHDDVRGIELRGDRVRHRDHAASRSAGTARARRAAPRPTARRSRARAPRAGGRARAARPSRTRCAASWSARRRRGVGAPARVSRATATGQPATYRPHSPAPWLVDSRAIGTTCRVAPVASNSAASGDGPGTAMWKSNSPRGRLRTSRRSAWSDPPRSATGCTERIVIVRVAVNVEQLLHEAPGGIGRYTAELLRLLPAHGVDVTPFRHALARRRDARAARAGPRRPRSGGPAAPRRRCCTTRGTCSASPARPARVAPVDLVHAPSPAVPPTRWRCRSSSPCTTPRRS